MKRIGAVFLVFLAFIFFAGCGTSKLSKQLDLADQYIQEGNYIEAEKVYNEILQNDPKNLKALEGLVLTYEGQGNSSKLMEVLKKAIENNTQNPDIPGLLAIEYADQGKQEEAKRSIVDSMKLNIDSKQAYSAIDVLFRSYWDGAIEWGNMLGRDASKENADSIVQIGKTIELYAQYNMGNYSEVIKIYKEIKKPGYKAIVLTAQAYYGIGDTKASENLIKGNENKLKGSPELLSDLMVYYEKTGDTRNALKLGEDGMEKFRNSPQLSAEYFKTKDSIEGVVIESLLVDINGDRKKELALITGKIGEDPEHLYEHINISIYSIYSKSLLYKQELGQEYDAITAYKTFVGDFTKDGVKDLFFRFAHVSATDAYPENYLVAFVNGNYKDIMKEHDFYSDVDCEIVNSSAAMISCPTISKSYAVELTPEQKDAYISDLNSFRPMDYVFDVSNKDSVGGSYNIVFSFFAGGLTCNADSTASVELTYAYANGSWKLLKMNVESTNGTKVVDGKQYQASNNTPAISLNRTILGNWQCVQDGTSYIMTISEDKIVVGITGSEILSQDGYKVLSVDGSTNKITIMVESSGKDTITIKDGGNTLLYKSSNGYESTWTKMR